MLKCESRIIREYKTLKADPLWPRCVYGDAPAEELEKYPEVCGGDVTTVLVAKDEPDWGCTYAKLELEMTCSRCKAPYVSGLLSFGRVDVTELFSTFAATEQVPHRRPLAEEIARLYGNANGPTSVS